MISYSQVIKLHSQLEKLELCSAGILHNDLLHSAINGQSWYSGVLEQHIHVAFSVNAFHVFNDGNKRTSFLVLKDLFKNRYLFNDKKLTSAILDLSSSKIDKEVFVTLVKEAVL